MLHTKITIDDGLEPTLKIPTDPRYETKAWLGDKLSDGKTDYRTRTRTQSLFPDWFDVAGDVPHRGYLEYLETCWAHHLGVVVTPDVVWQTVLGELAAEVASRPEEYRPLFTRSADKQGITVYGTPRNPAWLALVMAELSGLVPTDVERFVPTFGTTTSAALLARFGMFCDLVSPYYNYSVFCCGIPRIDFMGRVEDWEKLHGRAAGLAPLFPRLADYFAVLDTTLGRLHEELRSTSADADFFKGMFYMERCGSGSQREARGWWLNLFVQEQKLALPENFPTGLARVPFRDLTGGKDYVSVLGVLSSRDRGDGFREPLWGHVLLEKRPAETTPLLEKPYTTFVGK